MITITDKHKCCGCSACAQRCPKNSVTMRQDEEGFLYPQVDAKTCVDCGLCEKVCPVLTPMQSYEPMRVFAARNPDEDVREESSSGGVFTMLAERTVREGGIVFGANWDKNWNVKHSFTDTIEGLKVFRSSKYVQSNIDGNYKEAEAFLKDGRKVLFSGTPCQIAGLKAFLRRDYDNLLTIECACHGVPSPDLWQRYLAEVSNGKKIIYINHRDKRTGWRNYSVVIKYADGSELSELHDDNLWIRAFIKNIDLRPSCYQCAFKVFRSQADITLADLWGDRLLLTNQNDDKGITLLIARTPKARDFLIGVEAIQDYTLQDVVPFNGALVIPAKQHPRRSEFMTCMKKSESFSGLIKTMTKAPFVLRLKRVISRAIK